MWIHLLPASHTPTETVNVIASDTGCKIADALSSVPRIRPELFDSLFNSNLQVRGTRRFLYFLQSIETIVWTCLTDKLPVFV
jgi:hypothetical protein